MNEAQTTAYLNKQTRIQQQVIKERVEKICGTSQITTMPFRGVIVGRYQPGTEEKIVEAFRRSDETELPHLLGVKSRHVWVQGEVYLHFVEGQFSLKTILKEYARHPLFLEVKAELDQYVSLLYPDLPAAAREIYTWRNPREIQSFPQQRIEER